MNLVVRIPEKISSERNGHLRHFSSIESTKGTDVTRPHVVTISSEKGGVGKTTLATNLAIYLKAIDEDLPVTLFSFDNHFSVDRMFRIGRGAATGDMLQMLTTQSLEGLVELGEYGVQFVPSSAELASVRDQLPGPDFLGGILADSPLSGVVIIDTRPDLDIFTQNALFAADRVVVPVKDAPSLENCKHLYDFFDRQELPRRTIRVLPCLVDQRIHYDGPFRDPYQLLKAYAINRGYKCLEGYISKSPKVESLNTNPEGRIYPVLTHGRGTDVHGQFAHLARQIYAEILADGPRRLDRIATDLDRRRISTDASLAARQAWIKKVCLVCGAPLTIDQPFGFAGYYGETSDGEVTGFLEADCFTELVFPAFYGSASPADQSDPLLGLFHDTAQRSYYVLASVTDPQTDQRRALAFHRFDEDGLEISRKVVMLSDLLPPTEGDSQNPLEALLKATALLDQEQPIKNRFLVIRRVPGDSAPAILQDQPYQNFRRIFKQIAVQFTDR